MALYICGSGEDTLLLDSLMCTSLRSRTFEILGLSTLPADAELLDQIEIRLTVAPGDVAQQAAAFADHLQ